MSPYPQFDTQRLILKPTDEEDAAFIYRLMNTPKWLENIGDRQIHNEETARQYIQDRIGKQFERLGYGNYTMIRKKDGTKVGSCGLYDRAGLAGIDIGFALLPEYEGNGYAYEASLCLMQVAREEFGLRQLSAITIKTNEASQGLLEKLGLAFVEYITLPGDSEELMLYRITFK
ncbi:MAG: GNAT family N-acetyltransferase [Bacteroidota bacterium]